MLSYQHMYHAGCLADVHKHFCLSVILDELTQKDKPLTYMETHAGRGFYNLNSQEAKKTKEAESGIIKILAQNKLATDSPYFKVINKIKKEMGKSFYPGSPYIAQSLLREKDSLVFMELHPKENEALRKNIKSKNISFHKRDGYEGVLGISPPKQMRRGIVLIDPSYEVKAEYEQAANFILKLNQKWPEACIMLWYPILHSATHNLVSEKLQYANLPKFWQQEVLFKNDDINRAIGSGLIAVNTPFGLHLELDKVKDII